MSRRIESMSETLCELVDVSKWFTLKGKIRGKSLLKAVDGVSLKIKDGETIGLVGESGCGKTTLGRLLVRLYDPSGGRFYFSENGQNIDLFSLKNSEFEKFRSKIQMIFQDPYSSLNPRMTVLDIITEGLKNQGMTARERKNLASEMMQVVGLKREYLTRYPHEFSGGQRQRIGIARALVLKPKFLICDEPVSALDVSVQAQIINLLVELKESFGLTYLLISHDLGVVKYISDKIAVMYLGNIVEIAETDDLFDNPLHPYTKGLLDSIPVANPRLRKLSKGILLQGELTSPIDPPNACLFAPRCPYKMERCTQEKPKLKKVSEKHRVACFLY